MLVSWPQFPVKYIWDISGNYMFCDANRFHFQDESSELQATDNVQGQKKMFWYNINQGEYIVLLLHQSIWSFNISTPSNPLGIWTFKFPPPGQDQNCVQMPYLRFVFSSKNYHWTVLMCKLLIARTFQLLLRTPWESKSQFWL